ncbi:hypothetical protein [Runella zeae]|uniref:hypothetical protein n=1 Tax=Runella zeae TaxID=94255 RepID=UPI000560E777|nr:hypothetical protein [Runella zeae]
MPKYEFNDSGVCINPQVPFQIQNEGCALKISIAEHDDKWGYGYHAEILFGSCAGCGMGVAEKYCHYQTEKEVLIAVTDRVAEWIKHTQANQEPQYRYKFSCFKSFWEYHESLRQLSIF